MRVSDDSRAMDARRLRAAAAAGALATAIAVCTPADAQLPLPTAVLTTPVTAVTGVVGAVVTPTTQAVTGAVDQALATVGSATGGQLPTGTLDQLLSGVGPAQRASGGSSGVSGGGGSTVTIDTRAPKAVVTLLSRLQRVGQTGRLQVRVSLDEPGIVALRGTLRPGLRRHLPRALRRAPYLRRDVQIPSTVLAYNSPGALIVTISVNRTAQRILNRARDARLTLALLAADVAHNQAGATVLRHVPR
jgi:hypothetical protein